MMVITRDNAKNIRMLSFLWQCMLSSCIFYLFFFCYISINESKGHVKGWDYLRDALHEQLDVQIVAYSYQIKAYL